MDEKDIKLLEDLNQTLLNVTIALKNLETQLSNLNELSYDNLLESFDELFDKLEEMNENQSETMKITELYTTTLTILSATLTITKIAFEAFGKSIELNPYIIIIGAVTSLIAAFLNLSPATDDQTNKNLSLAESAKKASEEQKKLADEANEAAEKSNSVMDYYQGLKNELDTLVDADGRVLDSNKDRANFITSTLSEALGKEITLTGDVIDNYGELSSSLDFLIEKKRALSILEAHDDEYNNALENRSIAYKKLVEEQAKLVECEKNHSKEIEETTKKYMKLGYTEVQSREFAEAEWASRTDAIKNNIKEQTSTYEKYDTTVKNIDQARSDYYKNNFKDIEKTINGTNELYMNGSKERRGQLKKDIDQELFSMQMLNSKKGEMSAEQYDIEKKALENNLNEKRGRLLAANDLVYKDASSYESAMAYLSKAGSDAYDKNGNLTEAAQKKLSQLGAVTIKMKDEYSEALRELANEETVFGEDGKLTMAAQQKLVSTFTKINEMTPLYSEALSTMANNGEAVFDENGKLTNAAQQKLAEAFASIEEVNPKYSEILTDMAKSGKVVFDENGNLSETAQGKLIDAFLGMEELKPLYGESLTNMVNEGQIVFDENGKLTEAAQNKLLETFISMEELKPQYSEALSLMAYQGMSAFDENGNLTDAAQKKLIEVFGKLNEDKPKYSEILTQMVNDGKAVFDANGNLTQDAQKKLIDVYAGMTNLSPDYSKKLFAMVEQGKNVFDMNGNLTEAAKKKLEGAKTGADNGAGLFTDSLGKTAKDGVELISTADTYNAGFGFVSGAAKGAKDNKKTFLDIVAGIANSAVNFFKKIWDINSPSKKTRSLSKSFMEGLFQGIDKNKYGFLNSVQSIGQDALSEIESSFDSLDINSLGDKMRVAVAKQNLQMKGIVNSSYSSEMFASGRLKVELPELNATIKGKIENHIMMDGRETAVQLTPFISEELAFNTK